MRAASLSHGLLAGLLGLGGCHLIGGAGDLVFEASGSGGAGAQGGAASSSVASATGGAGGTTTTSATGGAGGSGGSAGCDNNNQCGSGFCAQGVCCDNACDSGCEACNLPGTEGVCTAVGAGEDPLDDCMPGVCDGALGCAEGTFVAAGDAAFTPSGTGVVSVEVGAIAQHPSDGALVIVGHFSGGTLDLGGNDLACATGTCGFIVKFSQGGAHEWSRIMTSLNGDVRPTAVAINDLDDVYVAGNSAGEVTYQGVGMAVGTPTSDFFAMRLSPTGATIVWQTYAGMGNLEATKALVDDNNDFKLFGYFNAAPDFPYDGLGAPSVTTPFILQFDPLNSFQAQRAPDVAVTRDGVGEIHDAVALADGSVLLAGRGTRAPCAGSAETSARVFLARLGDMAGGCSWTKPFGAPGNSSRVRVASDGSTVALAGVYSTANFGFDGIALPSAGSEPDIYVSWHDVASGDAVAAVAFDSPEAEAVGDLAIDAAGFVVVGGHTAGIVDFGAAAVGSANANDDGFLVKLAPGGPAIWAIGLEGGGDQRVTGVAGRHDELAIVGSFSTGVTLDSMYATNATDLAMFYARLVP